MSSKSPLEAINLQRGNGASLPEQLYAALRQEILRGRWQVGERIPSYKALTAATGLSQTSIQEALARLEDEGYVRRVRHRGVYVKSTVSGSNSSLGRVLIAVPADEPQRSGHAGLPFGTDVFGLVDVMALQREARELGLRSEVLPLPARNGKTTDLLDREDVLGLLSLVPAECLGPLADDPSLNTVYLGSNDPFSSPCLTGDPCRAAYLVYRELLRLGHRRIAVLPAPTVSATVRYEINRGITHAREEVGLANGVPAIEGPVDTSLQLAQIDDFLAANSICTAVMCLTVDDARRLVEVAAMRGRNVPADLSVASLQTGNLPDAQESTITGAAYPWPEIIKSCFQIFLDPDEFAERGLLRLVFAPFLQGSDSAIQLNDSPTQTE